MCGGTPQKQAEPKEVGRVFGKKDDFAQMKQAMDDFLKKEDSTLDRYDFFGKKVWLTVGKPEPQAAEFARILRNMADSFTHSSGWKVYYKSVCGGQENADR
jgi:hypothetical protein